MKRAAMSLLLAGFTLLVSVRPAFAHHSFAGQYDKDKPIQLSGTVTKMEWMNPHARFYIDVKDESGKVTNWNIELGPPLTLRRAGWTRDSLKVGDQITVQGYPAKDGARMANARKVKFSDGRQVFAGSSADSSPTQ